MINQKVAQQKTLLAQAGSPVVRRKEIAQLITEDAGTRRLKENDGQAGVDLDSQLLHHPFQISPRLGQKAEIIKRTPAADMPARHLHRKASLFENRLSRLQRIRMV